MSIQLPHAVGSPLFRSSLAEAVSATRRARPKLPFWKLQAHRLPTLHLYRSLLRLAPTENIYFRIGLLFRENRHLTSTKEVTKVLLQAYRLQETLAAAKSEDRTQKLIQRYDRLIQGKRAKARYLEQEQNEIEWRRKMFHRPIMTGGFMHATLYNGPLPRLKPQPDHITGLIRFRRKKYITKFAKHREIKEASKQMNFEAQFEAKLIKDPTKQIYAAYVDEWTAPIKAEHARITAWFEACYRRCQTPIPQSLFDQVIQARREKIINKARQRIRERKGEVLRSTIERRRQGPPAHVLAQLSPKCREEDKYVRRGVSEVGYLGMLKARKGFALKRRDGEIKETKQGTMRWSVEEGRWISDAIQQITKDRWRAIEQENRRRRGESSA